METITKRKYFGTDGVRDLANTGNMTPELALKLGRAFIKFNCGKKIVIGLDTRLSGSMLEAALCAGMTSEGADVFSAGIIPTPGVSFALKYLKADGGAVISASHNPAEYNGIKFLGADGCKLSDEEELAIENLLESEKQNQPIQPGKIQTNPDLVKNYAEHIADFLENDAVFDKIVFDCACGASAMSVPVLIEKTKLSAHGAKIISQDFNGLNINKNCGVMHMENLTGYVVKNKMSLGFAFDGDADRVLVSDSKGRIIDGDIILWILARFLHKRNKNNNQVVVTVMSNLALENKLKEEGIKTLRCPVGDRYVLETMRENNAVLGGEQSGHIIASEFTSTGDGLCTAVLFLNAVKELNEDVSTLVDRFGRYPQRLTNLTLTKPRETLDMNAVNEIVSKYENEISNLNGRIFVRTSGTEPLLRILVEAPEAKTVKEFSDILSQQLQKFC